MTPLWTIIQTCVTTFSEDTLLLCLSSITWHSSLSIKNTMTLKGLTSQPILAGVLPASKLPGWKNKSLLTLSLCWKKEWITVLDKQQFLLTSRTPQCAHQFFCFICDNMSATQCAVPFLKIWGMASFLASTFLFWNKSSSHDGVHCKQPVLSHCSSAKFFKWWQEHILAASDYTEDLVFMSSQISSSG